MFICLNNVLKYKVESGLYKLYIYSLPLIFTANSLISYIKSIKACVNLQAILLTKDRVWIFIFVATKLHKSTYRTEYRDSKIK